VLYKNLIDFMNAIFGHSIVGHHRSKSQVDTALHLFHHVGWRNEHGGIFDGLLIRKLQIGKVLGSLQ